MESSVGYVCFSVSAFMFKQILARPLTHCVYTSVVCFASMFHKNRFILLHGLMEFHCMGLIAHCSCIILRSGLHKAIAVKCGMVLLLWILFLLVV